MGVHDETIAHHPHDGLVKRTFTIREAAAVELQHVLPASLCERLDWDTLKIEPTAFIDPQLRPRTTDILYSIVPKGSTVPISIYALLEHQSTPDPAMAARFLVYVGRFYERYLREHPGAKSVPMVIPLLLFQGPDGWTLPTRLSALLDVPPELAAVYPSPIELAFAVDDLSESLLGEQVTRDQLARDRWRARAEVARSLLWLVRHPEASTGERAAALGMLLDFIAQSWGPVAIEPFLTYFVAAFEPQSPLRGILVDAISQETRLMYATIRDELLAQGRDQGVAEGRAEGKAEGKAEMLLTLLTTRGLLITVEHQQRIGRCRDEALLQRWFERAIMAADVDDVFED